jgi:hypothetical protein
LASGNVRNWAEDLQPVSAVELTTDELRPLALRAFPNRFGYGSDQLKFAPLLFFAQRITSSRRGEAALRAERKLLQRDVLRGLVDLPLYLVLRLQIAMFGGDQAEHDNFSFGT